SRTVGSNGLFSRSSEAHPLVPISALIALVSECLVLGRQPVRLTAGRARQIARVGLALRAQSRPPAGIGEHPALDLLLVLEDPVVVLGPVAGVIIGVGHQDLRS